MSTDQHIEYHAQVATFNRGCARILKRDRNAQEARQCERTARHHERVLRKLAETIIQENAGAIAFVSKLTKG